MEQYTIYEQENVVPKGSTREKKLENDKLCGFYAAFAIILLSVFFFLSLARLEFYRCENGWR